MGEGSRGNDFEATTVSVAAEPVEVQPNRAEVRTGRIQTGLHTLVSERCVPPLHGRGNRLVPLHPAPLLLLVTFSLLRQEEGIPKAIYKPPPSIRGMELKGEVFSSSSSSSSSSWGTA